MAWNKTLDEYAQYVVYYADRLVTDGRITKSGLFGTPSIRSVFVEELVQAVQAYREAVRMERLATRAADIVIARNK
jgi:hypothetical protein